jgi:hypothetical protein
MLQQGLDPASELVATENQRLYDSALFAAVWQPCITALAHVFDTAVDESIIRHVVNGFRSCARVSAGLGVAPVFQKLFLTLASRTLLAVKIDPNDIYSTHEAYELCVTQLAHSTKAQLVRYTLRWSCTPQHRS